MNMSNNCGKFQLDGVVYEISNDRSSFKSRSLRLHRMNAFIRFGPRTRSQTKALQDEANDTCPIKTLNYFSFNTSSNYSSRSNVFGSSNSLQNYIKMSLESTVYECYELNSVSCYYQNFSSVLWLFWFLRCKKFGQKCRKWWRWRWWITWRKTCPSNAFLESLSMYRFMQIERMPLHMHFKI